MPPELSLLPGLDGLLGLDVPPEHWEGRLAAEGVGPVAAIDEAGRGPLAGPVVAAAVIFRGPCAVEGVNDSKQLTPEQRERLAPVIRREAAAWAVGSATAEEIDAVNILEATRLAARRALEALGMAPAVILTDALSLPGTAAPVVPIVKGDARVRAIGAASILAKVHRDRLMRRAAREWPQYGFERHFGYPTPAHRRCIEEAGPSTFHRLTFNCARPAPGQGLVSSRSAAALGALIAAAPPGDRAGLRGRILRRAGLLPRREIDALLARCAG